MQTGGESDLQRMYTGTQLQCALSGTVGDEELGALFRRGRRLAPFALAVHA